MGSGEENAVHRIMRMCARARGADRVGQAIRTRIRRAAVHMRAGSAVSAGRRLVLGCAVAVIGAVLPAGIASAQSDPPHVLVFSYTDGFHHSSIEYGYSVIAQLAAQTGAFTVEFAASPADINARKLSEVDLVLF